MTTDSDTTADGVRTLELTITPQRQVRLVSLTIADGGVQSAQIEGRDVPVADGTLAAVFNAPPADGVHVTLTLSGDQEAVLQVADGSDGLEDLPGFEPRPPGVGILGSHTSRAGAGGNDRHALGWAALQVAATSCSPLRMVTMTRLPARATALVGALMLLAACSGTPEPSAAEQRRDVGVQLFQWTWDAIAAECTDTLGPDGYAWVLTSPPQEHIVGEQWWTSYQPVSYRVESRLGTREQYAAMVQTCHDAGRRRVGRRGGQPHDRPGRRPAPAGRARRTRTTTTPGSGPTPTSTTAG